MQENVNIPDSTITSALTFRNLVLMNMQQLTNFPYIEKDFDALTDYELLCLVVKFLNDVIANQNEQNDSITNMYNAFLALQTYVNNTKDTLEDAFNTLDDYVRNYFDNLDVQDEINNKLDIMATNGTLIELIASYLPIIYPEMYGAIGDGETDDTTAIQTAINTANSTKGQLHFMKKTYKITDSLTIYSGMEINGNNATITLNANKPIITSQSVINNINIHDINLRGSNNDEYTSNDGLYLTCYYSNFDNIRINDCEHGIYLDTTGATGTLVENRFNNLTIYNCNYSLYGGPYSNNKITDGFVTNSIFNNKSDSHPAVYIGSSAGWTIDSIHIYGSCNYGIVCDNAFYTNISNIYVEEAKNALISGSIQNNLNISNINGILKYSNCMGIRLDQASFHYPVSGANINNVYLVVKDDATNSVGINIMNTALKLSVSNYTQSVSADNLTFKDFNTYTNINVHFVKNKLTDLNFSGTLFFKNSFVGLSFKKDFAGTSEQTISIPLDNRIFAYSMSKISIKMISKQYWDGGVSINYSTDVILVDKNGTRTVSKVNENGASAGFTSAPTCAYNSTNNTLDVTFTPSASNHNGYLFADIV